MFSMIKLGALLALVAPFTSALKLTSVTGNFVVGGDITITWTSDASDPSSFSVELIPQSAPSNQLAIDTNVLTSAGTDTIELPVQDLTDTYTIALVDIENINSVFAVSKSFSIGAENTTESTTVKAGTVPSTSITPISTPSAPSSLSTSGASTPVSPIVSTTSTGSTGSTTPTSPAAGNSTPTGSTPSGSSPSASPTGAALSTRAVPAAIMVALAGVAGALAF